MQKGSKRRPAGPVAFKYYIHDTAAGYVLEMFGPLAQASLYELTCCWQTAKGTLRGRSLILSLSGLSSIDESARQWLASMAHEGAKYVPESFLRDLAAESDSAAQETLQRGTLERFSSAVRGQPATQEL